MFRRLLIASFLASACIAHSAGRAPVYKLLYSPSSNIMTTFSPILEIKPGLFYVLSQFGLGTVGFSIFSLTSTGTFNSIYSFPSYTESLNLVQGTNGDLYGPAFNPSDPKNSPSTYYYSLDLSGKDLRVYNYPSPQWGSVWQTALAPPGALYDILARPSANYGPPIFAFARIEEGGKITILHQFSTSDGYPTSLNAIVRGPDGNFYGIGYERYHGVSPGFIYRLTPAGAYSKLLTYPWMPTAGGVAALPLVAASDGNLYGTFNVGGTNNTGTVYQATLSGQLQTVADFPATGMAEPRTLMEAADGNLYGTTNYNQIFRYNLATYSLGAVYRMPVDGTQGKCGCDLIEGMDGKLYGAAPYGGPFPGLGAVFSLDIGLPKPLPAVSGLYPLSGPVGQRVLLWGNYLLGATSVTFNGVPASTVSVTSAQSVYATVPPGATTGPVTITTANGSYTTTQSFTLASGVKTRLQD